MLKRIEIQNYAIIDHLEIEFPEGLTIITGETGAGKSILLGALGLVMGNRADTKVLYDQERKCIVEAIFDIRAYTLQEYFNEADLEYSDELIIRREIAPGGKSRAFVNDTPATLDILTSLSASLVNIHGQFDTLDIQKPASQIEILDALAGNKALLTDYKKLYRQYRSLTSRLEDLKNSSKNASQEMEFLAFQRKEFEDAGWKEGEQEALETSLRRLTGAEDVKRLSQLLAHGLAEDEQAVIGQLHQMSGQYAAITGLDAGFLDIHSRLVSVKEELSDIARECARIAEATDFDEEAIHYANQRLGILYRLMKKHQVVTESELLDVQHHIQHKMGGYTSLDQEIQELSIQCAQKEQQLRDIALQLRANRGGIIEAFQENVHTLLVSLAMEHAYIRVQMTPLEQLTPSGSDEIAILFAPNKGSQFLPLKDIASGGELSRLTLCMKSLVAGAATMPTLVFDEIDAGVSGEVAHKMGTILASLAKAHQVICITHSPQIAAKADVHLWVYKSENETRTMAAMRTLTLDDRITELAKMLSGNPPTEGARLNARELLGLHSGS
jgi:DNA repair protein RecN (Recombination protein N)